MREKTAAAERWHYIRSVLDRRRERNHFLRQHFLRQPLESMMEARAKMPVIRPLSPQKSILKNKGAQPEGAQLQGAPSVVIDGDLTKSTLWMEAASALKLADQWSKKRNVKVRFSQEDVYDWQADDNALKLPALRTADAVQWAAGSRKPQVGHQSADRLPSLVGVAGGTDNDQQAEWVVQEEAADDGGTVTSKGPSWAERQVAKVKRRKLWSSTTVSVAALQQEPTAKIKTLRPCHPSERLLRRTASMIVQMSDEGDNSSSPSSRSSQSPSPPAAEVETVPVLLLNDCSPSATDGGSMDGAHSPPDRPRPASTSETLAWDIPLQEQSIPAAEGGHQQEGGARQEEAELPYGGWPQFPARLARNMSQRAERIKRRTRTRLDRVQPPVKGHRIKRTPRWIKGKRPTRNHPPTQQEKCVKEARNLHLRGQVDEVSGGSIPHLNPANERTDDSPPPTTGQGTTNAVHQSDDNVKAAEQDTESADDCQCRCQYRAPCLHKAVLYCLLPESLNEALTNIETIRQQLKRTRLRRGRYKQ